MNIDRAHRLGPKKDKKQAIAIKFTTFRHRTLFFGARRKLENGVKLHVDLSKKRFKLLLDAQKYVENVQEAQFVYANVNCNMKVKFRNNEESFFTSMQELEDIYWISRFLFLSVAISSNFLICRHFIITIIIVIFIIGIIFM